MSGKNIKLDNSWLKYLEAEFSKNYMLELKNFLAEEKSKYTIYPLNQNIFSAFNSTPFDKVKVIILGQDPYHGPGQAHGLCFSVQPGIPTPPSLMNIYKEIKSDLDIPIPNHGYLQAWATQGVFLLNTILTVRHKNPLSHAKKGWETFTDEVISTLNNEKENLIFVLWGSPARKKRSMIDDKKHLILEAPHPSPLSAHRGFLGCKHFSKINAYLKENGLDEINWALPEVVSN